MATPCPCGLLENKRSEDEYQGSDGQKIEYLRRLWSLRRIVKHRVWKVRLHDLIFGLLTFRPRLFLECKNIHREASLSLVGIILIHTFGRLSPPFDSCWILSSNWLQLPAQHRCRRGIGREFCGIVWWRDGLSMLVHGYRRVHLFHQIKQIA